MPNEIFNEFLENTTRAGIELALQSDVLHLARLPARGEGLFLCQFAVPFLARSPDGTIEVDPGPLHAAIRLTPDYLRQVDALGLVQIQQRQFFHSNFRWPVLCVGDVRPGTPLPNLLRQVYEIITYQNFATDDGLDLEACARLCLEPQLLDRLPRPKRLVRRPIVLEPEEIKAPA